MTVNTQKIVNILGAFTGPTGTFEQVNIIGSFTGPTGTFPQWQKATGPTGPSGTFKSVINVGGPTGFISPRGNIKTVIIPGFSYVTPATLSAPTLVATAATTATAGATTDTGTGTLYFVVTTNSSTPTAAQIKAGKDASGSAAPFSGNLTPTVGVNTINATGLTPLTAYYMFAIQNDGLDSNIVTAGPATTNATQTTAFLARTSGLNATHTNAYKAMIDGMVSDGVFQKLDVFYVHATQDSTTALLNLVSSSFTGTAHGSPTFTADRGFQGTSGSSTVYIDTGFNPSSAPSPNYTTNSAHIMGWPLTNAADTACCGASVSGVNSYPIPRLSGDLFYCRINNAPGGSDNVANASSIGQFIVNRSGASATQGYKNGSSVLTPNVASNGNPNINLYTCGWNNAGTPDGYGQQMAAMSCGGSLSGTDVTNFYNRLRTYLTAVGVP